MIITIASIAASVEVIPLTKVGLFFDKYSVELKTDKLYTPGRYYIMPGNTFITFPSTEQTLIFSTTIMEEKQKKNATYEETEYIFETLRTRSNEGLIVYLDFVINFKLTTTDDPAEQAVQLASLYRSFGDDWYKAVY